MYIKLNNRQLLSIKKLKKLREKMPSDERIKQHFQEEFSLRSQNSKYKPQPMLVEVEDELYKEIIEEIQLKAKFTDLGFFAIVKNSNIPTLMYIKKKSLKLE